MCPFLLTRCGCYNCSLLRLRRSLTLAAAASGQDWEWLCLRRPDVPPPPEDEAPSHSQGPFSGVYTTVGPLCRWLRLSIRNCGREGAAVLQGAAGGLYAELLEGADCLRLVARELKDICNTSLSYYSSIRTSCMPIPCGPCG